MAADGPNPTTGSGKAKAIPPQESLRKDLTSLARDLTVLRTGSTQEQLGVLRKMTENVSQRQFNEIVTNGANLVNAMSKVMTPQEAGAAIDRAVSLINTADQIYTRVSNVANALAPVAKMMGIGDGGPISLPPALEGLIPRNRGEMLQMGAKLARGAAPFVQQQFGAARADVTMSAANLMQSLANANLRPQGADGPLQLTLDKNVSDAAAFLMRTTQESRVLPDIQIPAAIRNSQDLKLIGTFVQRAAGGDGVLDGRDIRPVIRGGVNDLAQVRPLLAAFGANIIEEKAAPKVAEGFKKLGIPADPLGRGDGGSRNLGGPNMTFNALPQAVERFQRSIGSMGTPPGGLGGTDNGIRVTFPNGIPATAIPDIQAGRLPTGPVIVIERRR